MRLKRRTYDPAQYILQAGYWSDDAAARGEGPDVFFFHMTGPVPLAEAVDLIAEAVRDKYGLEETPWADLFWSSSPRERSPR